MIKTYKIEITDEFIITTMEVVIDDFITIVNKKNKINSTYEYTNLSIRNLDGSPVSENQTVSAKVTDVNGKMQNLVYKINELINKFIQEIS